MNRTRGFLESFTVQLVAVVMGIVCIAVVVAFQWQIHDNGIHDQNRAQCVEDWANDFTERQVSITAANGILQVASAARNDALDNLVISLTKPSDVEFVKRPEFQAYLKASTKYQSAQAEYTNQLAGHPIPPAPQFACH